MKNLQKGSSKVVIILLVIILLVIIFGVYKYSKNDQVLPQQLSNSQTTDKMSACNYVYQDREFFFATTTNYLLIDAGTAPPPRALTFYDLNKCEKVLDVMYSYPIDVKADSVTYWEPVSITPTEANCPDLSTWKSGGLGAGIESHVTINLNDLSKKSLNQFRCEPRQ